MCYEKKYTIADYNRDCKEENVKELAKFVYERFSERYIKPFKKMNPDFKNGFCIMAIACLLIETLENFWQGKAETPQGKGTEYFESFFTRCTDIQNELAAFKGLNFYSQVRCGILHQGETKAGWTIRRAGPLLTKESKVINATKFLVHLSKYLKWYQEELVISNFKNDEIWENFRLKMEAIKNNCKSK